VVLTVCLAGLVSCRPKMRGTKCSKYNCPADENRVCKKKGVFDICVCKKGFRPAGPSRECVPVVATVLHQIMGETDGFCATSNCGLNHYCKNMPTTYQCFLIQPKECEDGYALDNYGDCADVNECDGHHVSCGDDKVCHNTEGSYDCVCEDGLVDDGYGGCEDVDECEYDDTCGDNQVCRNTHGSFSCDCINGFELNSTMECVDIDECAKPGCCAPSQSCVNTEGSYHCVGKGHNSDCELYAVKGDPRSYQVKEYIGNVFQHMRTMACAPETKFSVDDCICVHDADYMAVYHTKTYCPHGHKMVNHKCVDINECEDYKNICGKQGCSNEMGSYKCYDCEDGYKANNGKCVKVCDAFEAVPGSKYKFKHGNAILTCAAGTEFSASECKCVHSHYEKSYGVYHQPDVCNGVECGDDHVCHELEGLPNCKLVKCKLGYDLIDGHCKDINECAVDHECCPHGKTCINTVGSFICLA